MCRCLCINKYNYHIYNYGITWDPAGGIDAAIKGDQLFACRSRAGAIGAADHSVAHGVFPFISAVGLLTLEEMPGTDGETLVVKENDCCGGETLVAENVSNDAQPVLLDEVADG